VSTFGDKFAGQENRKVWDSMQKNHCQTLPQGKAHFQFVVFLNKDLNLEFYKESVVCTEIQNITKAFL